MGRRATESLDEREFEARIDAHRGIVYKLANTYASREADRDDLVQEICLQLWRAYPSYDPSRRFSTWMYRVTLNTAISFARAAHTRDRRAVPLEDAPASALADPGAQDETEVRLPRLERCLRGLGELDRALVVLYLEERSYAEIGEILGLSATNVGTKLNRLKQKMRRDLAPTKGD